VVWQTRSIVYLSVVHEQPRVREGSMAKRKENAQPKEKPEKPLARERRSMLSRERLKGKQPLCVSCKSKDLAEVDQSTGHVLCPTLDRKNWRPTPCVPGECKHHSK
jgi:hypothetical protein